MDGSAHSEAAAQQLLRYRFPAQADFGGLLLGALQRVESGGAIRVLEILFVARGDGPQEIAVLGDAVARTGGAPFASELLEPTEVPEAWARLPSELSRARS